MTRLEQTTPAARETIAAVASPPGRAPRAVVRLSGPGSRAVAERLLSLRDPVRGVHRVRVRHDAFGEGLPALALWMPEGRSFTGEDSLEVSCVGSPVVAEALVDALVESARSAGFDARRARGGEFAMRAHLAGRLAIDAAEGIAARIAATNDAELAAADEVAHGVYGLRAADLAARTAALLALVEAGIDFTDQDDVVAIDAEDFARRVAALASETRGLRGGDAGAGGRAVATVVLAGAPNAGKSALFNALVGAARVVSSPVRGTTRDAIRARISLGGAVQAELVDVAGIEISAAAGERQPAARGTQPAARKSQAAARKSQAAARESQAAAREPQAAARAIDPATHRFAADMQRQAAQWIGRADIVLRCTPAGAARIAVAPAGTATVEVATMCDLAPAAEDAIATSARTGVGIEALRAVLRERVQRDHALRGAQLAMILPRHAEFLARAAELLDEAGARGRGATPGEFESTPGEFESTPGEFGSTPRDFGSTPGATPPTPTRRALAAPEVAASLLRLALDALGEVSAPVHPDDVLGLVFSRFCIGK